MSSSKQQTNFPLNTIFPQFQYKNELRVEFSSHIKFLIKIDAVERLW